MDEHLTHEPLQSPTESQSAGCEAQTQQSKLFPWHLMVPHDGWGLHPVDWRWRLAEHLAAGGGHPKRFTPDRTIRAAASYLRARRRGRPPATRIVTESIKQAIAIHNGDARLRGEVEARMLAGQDPATIGSKTSLEPAIVEAYALLFFDVADRLGGRSAIRAVAFSKMLNDDLDESDVAELMKRLAYGGGAIVLEDYLNYLRNPAPVVPKKLSGLTDAQLDEVEKWLSVRGCILAMTIRTETDYDKIRFGWIHLGCQT